MEALGVDTWHGLGLSVVFWSGVVVALSQLHRKLVRPAIEAVRATVKLLRELHALVPTLREIALEFKKDHGSSLRDVVDRIEEKVAHGTTVTRVILAHSEFAHFEMDAEGRCTWANESYLRMTALKLEEVLLYGWYNCIDMKDRGLVSREWETAKRDKRVFIANFNIMRDFERVPVTMRCVLTCDPSGNMIGAVGTMTLRDDTEARAA